MQEVDLEQSTTTTVDTADAANSPSLPDQSTVSLETNALTETQKNQKEAAVTPQPNVQEKALGDFFGEEVIVANQEPPEIAPQNDREFSPPNQPAEAVSGEVIRDEASLLGEIENMTKDPGAFSPDQAQQVLRDAVAGRSFDRVKQESPKLVEALQALHESQNNLVESDTLMILKTLDPDNPVLQSNDLETIQAEALLLTQEDVESVMREEDGQDLIVETKLPNGETAKLKISEIMLIAALVAADLALFQGRNLMLLVEDLGRAGGEELTRGLMGKLGFEVPEGSFAQTKIYERLLDHMDSRQLVKMLEEMPNQGTEVYRFLEGLGEEDRQKLLAGKKFGGRLGSKHRLDQEQIGMVVNKLTNSQKRVLEVDKYQQQDKK